jgi:SAM-dependent methyltransferase
MHGMDADTTPNDAMAQNWNGAGGDHWVAHADRHDRALAGYGDAVLRAAAIEPGDRVLDVGCGTGALTRAAANLAGDGATLGVDIGQPLVDAARAETASEGGPANVAFERADAQVHPFPARGLDVVISRFGVMFFDDPTAAFSNLRRGMVDGGRLAFVCWQDIFANDWMLVPVGAMAEHLGLPAVAGPDAPGPFALADPDRVRTVLATAGFADVALAGEAHPMWLGTDLDDAVAYMRGQPMARLMFEDKDPALVETAVASLRAALAPHVTSDGLSLPGRAWLVTARAA